LESKDLRKAGLKVTGPRLKILEILEGSPTRHMSAEGIYKRLIESNEDIGLATVYRVLTQFQAAGLVARHHFEDGMAVFELNQGTHHDHIVCLDCGRVEEFMDSSIEERQASTRHCASAPCAAKTSSMALPSAENIHRNAVSTLEESRNELRLSRMTASSEPRRTFWRSTAILVQAMSTPSVGLPPLADHTPVAKTSDAVGSPGCSGA